REALYPGNIYYNNANKNAITLITNLGNCVRSNILTPGLLTLFSIITALCAVFNFKTLTKVN
ncbi:hypothetical protein LEK84_13355, partial [Salmonella enterica]|nr:hypothetical protein [Salmonella enterica]